MECLSTLVSEHLSRGFWKCCHRPQRTAQHQDHQRTFRI